MEPTKSAIPLNDADRIRSRPVSACSRSRMTSDFDTLRCCDSVSISAMSVSGNRTVSVFTPTLYCVTVNRATRGGGAAAWSLPPLDFCLFARFGRQKYRIRAPYGVLRRPYQTFPLSIDSPLSESVLPLTKGLGTLPEMSIQTLLVWRYSWMASAPLSRPIPDRL